MIKRFTKKDYTVLSLLSRGKTLDDLLEYAPQESHYYNVANCQALTQLVRDHKAGRERMTPLQRVAVDQMAKQVIAYKEAYRQFRQSKTHVQINNEREEAYDQLAEKFPDFEPSIDRLCQTQLPLAYYIPLATFEIMQRSGQAMMNKIGDLVTDLPDECGLLLFEPFVGSKQLNTFAYRVSPTGLSGFLITQSMENGIMNVPDFFHIDFTNRRMASIEDGNTFGGVCIASLLFIHFFETERVVAVQPVPNARSTARVELNGNKYDSELTYPINVVDAFWYTTIIRDDPFLVKGHFRKQPYGPGRSQYKVRWITGYMKKGYHRAAKQPNEQANSTLLIDAENQDFVR